MPKADCSKNIALNILEYLLSSWSSEYVDPIFRNLLCNN